MRVLISGGEGDVAQAIARRLEQEGHTIFTPSRREMDVTVPQSVYDYMQKHRPDVVICAAGAIVPEPVMEASNIRWQHQINVNLLGVYYCAKYGIYFGSKQTIIIGSSAGRRGKADWSAYCAAKAGAERLMESLHEEGYFATCIRLGRTNTKMRTALFGEEDPATLLPPDHVAEIVSGMMLEPNVYSGKIMEVSAPCK